MITIDILDRSYAKKLFNGLSSGYQSSTVTDNADGSKTLTINFVNGDKANITFNPVKGDKGETGTSVQDIKIKEISGVRHLIVTLDDSTEIDAGALPNEQYDDTQIKKDIVDLKTDKQYKTDNSLNTTDKTVTGAINEVNGNLLDNVTFSADYKNIILNRKSGLNPYTIPISSIIHNAKLTELNDIDSADIGNGKILVYDSTTKKHKYVDLTGTDELVKMDSTTDAKYLTDLIDKQTVVNENGTLKVKKLDGQEVTIAEINYLKGLTMNVMDLVNMFANGGVKIINAPVNTYADLLVYDKSSLIDGISYLIYVLADETHNGAKTTYLIDKATTTPTFFGNADSQRNFVTNPIDLANEVTGKLPTDNIDVDALWLLLTINNTYKTLTTKNEPFGTHGAKAMYDELVTAIGDKANSDDFTKHTGDTDIHITSAERTKWNEVDNKVNKTDITTTIDNTVTDEQIASARAVLRSKSAIHMDESVNPENYEVGAWFVEGHDDILLSTSYGHPCSEWHIGYVVTGYEASDGKGYKIILAIAMSGNCYIKVQRWDTWTKWINIETTSVADVANSSLSLNNTTAFTEGTITYNVTNGICDLTLAGFTNSICSAYKLSTTSFPTPKNKLVTVPIVNDVNGETVGMFYIDSNYSSIPTCHIYKTSCRGFCSISYKVAES